ncbi:Rad18 Rhp18 [Schizosaccharomyces japonicus yFS275]|uniref:Postreplication repair E3 ubiquitin-protein ligase RAD18 n=1 Tax=Schizosaccharomyces japonicus (strain yFS275 / FY16936) TaxID=402676 RepID=B6JWP1_SCHJY|nr:Rad18 Rhp18 [Schizosaccharomyces japonicus yFS275]EEB05792.1 Rad18 Rhp18 [Schizosaccharomyces japonicus yFS275]
MQADTTDSSDWQNTRLPSLTSFESLLRCPICHDFFSGPLITSCCHSFCSYCIRCYLKDHSICPICRSEQQESRLRKNLVVEELVEGFNKLRSSLLEQLAPVPEPIPESESKSICLPEPIVEDELVYVDEVSNSPSMTIKNSPSPVVSIPSRSSRASTGKKRKVAPATVPCPICDDQISEDQIQSHVNACIDKQEKAASLQHEIQELESSLNSLADSNASRSKTNALKRTLLSKRNTLQRLRTPQSILPSSSSSSSTSLATTNSGLSVSVTSTVSRNHREMPIEERVRLPKITYAILSESKMRSKLSELGLPTDGNKQTLQRRHSQWVTMYNANLDRTHPVTRAVLLRELRDWEYAQSRKPIVKRDKIGGPDWEKLYADDFERLVGNARNNMKRNSTAKKPGESKNNISAGASSDAAREPTSHESEV